MNYRSKTLQEIIQSQAKRTRELEAENKRLREKVAELEEQREDDYLQGAADAARDDYYEDLRHE